VARAITGTPSRSFPTSSTIVPLSRKKFKCLVNLCGVMDHGVVPVNGSSPSIHPVKRAVCFLRLVSGDSLGSVMGAEEIFIPDLLSPAPGRVFWA
jgi:hypothetical protein